MDVLRWQYYGMGLYKLYGDQFLYLLLCSTKAGNSTLHTDIMFSNRPRIKVDLLTWGSAVQNMN